MKEYITNDIFQTSLEYIIFDKSIKVMKDQCRVAAATATATDKGQKN